MSQTNSANTFSPVSLAIGMLSGITVKFAGTVYIGEILSISYLVLTVRLNPSPQKLIPKYLIWFVALWAIAQLFSDILNNSTIPDTLKGVGAPIVFLLSMLGLLSFFIRKSNRYPSFLIGLALGILLDLVALNPTQYFLTSNQWKWGYGNAITSIVIVLTSFFFSKQSQNKFSLTTLSLLIILAAIGISNDSRGSLGFIIIYGVYILCNCYPLNLGIERLRYDTSKGVPILMGVILSFLILINFSLGILYTQTPIASLLSPATYEKTVRQAKSSLGLLAGGRSEFFASSQAFLDKPLLGHGSWAQDPTGFYNSLRLQRAYDFGEDIDTEIQAGNIFRQEFVLIPAHSFLMGNLVWSGVFGGLIWFYVLYALADIFIRFHSSLNFYFFNGLSALTWSIFFNPFSYTTRFSTAVFLASLFAFVAFSSSRSGLVRR